ncbi:MAG TPA: FxLYD domain-containing protein [Methylomirabilota bacterium]|jgi:hypothetical protein
MLAPRGLLRALLALALVLSASSALAQSGFRINYEVDQSRPDKARLNGRVANERGQDVFEVSVTAEALDARGKVLARGISYVDSRIGRGDSRPFSVSVPTVPGVTEFRVVVSSYRMGFANQGP